MNKLIVNILLVTLLLIATAEAGQKFEGLKDELARANLVELNVSIIIKSNIFGDVDSISGKIIIAEDSRYFAIMDNDKYWFDGNCISEYIWENNQLTKDCLDEGEHFESELLFIKNFDKYYTTREIETDSLYSLVKTDSLAVSLPDSLKVIFFQDNLDVPILEYYDLNNDLNIVSINQREMFDSIPDDIFNPAIPDSVEIIILP